MKGKGDLMGDIMFSRPGDTPSSGGHGPLVCEEHGKTQDTFGRQYTPLPPGRHIQPLSTRRSSRSLPIERHNKSLPPGRQYKYAPLITKQVSLAHESDQSLQVRRQCQCPLVPPLNRVSPGRERILLYRCDYLTHSCDIPTHPIF